MLYQNVFDNQLMTKKGTLKHTFNLKQEYMGELSRQYPAETMTDEDYTDIALVVNTAAQDNLPRANSISNIF